jgi:hypothetical protein
MYVSSRRSIIGPGVVPFGGTDRIALFGFDVAIMEDVVVHFVVVELETEEGVD